MSNSLGSHSNVDGAPVPVETAGRENDGGQPGDVLERIRELAEEHAQPAHDEEAYYNPPPRSNPWEGIGYLALAVTAGVAGWLLWRWLGA
jgi:hypothetical protein